MSTPGKRISILSESEVQDVYSVPQLNSQERDHFFDFSEEELAAAKGLHSHQTRIHFLLMLGYFKLKSVCLVYSWKDVEVDYRYLVQRYYPKANKKRHSITRHTRSRLYKKVCSMERYQRFDTEIEDGLLSNLIKRAKIYVDEIQLFKDAIQFLKSKRIAIPAYSTLQKLLSRTINTEEARLSELLRKHLKDKTPFLRLIDSQEKQYRL
ncbi:MAG: DUF4158 domain-containing protein, partial [Pseudomonadales bacterium]|nr:DUF4158 domain-containing protein [Pseudomonadales bacterium]